MKALDPLNTKAEPHPPRAGPAFLRVRDIVRPNGVLPISRATWYAWVAAAKAPRGIALSPGIVVWSREAVLALVEGK